MTKAQALALVNALEAQTIPCIVALTFDQAGTEAWSVQLDTARSYSGAELTTLANYCTQHGLALTVIFQQIGVV